MLNEMQLRALTFYQKQAKFVIIGQDTDNVRIQHKDYQFTLHVTPNRLVEITDHNVPVGMQRNINSLIASLIEFRNSTPRIPS